MEYVYIALLLLACFVPAGYLVLKTNQAKKRGCGRGCATCGNKNFCHRSELRVDRKRGTKPEPPAAGDEVAGGDILYSRIRRQIRSTSSRGSSGYRGRVSTRAAM